MCRSEVRSWWAFQSVKHNQDDAVRAHLHSLYLLTDYKPQLNWLKTLYKFHMKTRNLSPLALPYADVVSVRFVKMNSLASCRSSGSQFTVLERRITGQFTQSFRDVRQCAAGCPGRKALQQKWVCPLQNFLSWRVRNTKTHNLIDIKTCNSS